MGLLGKKLSFWVFIKNRISIKKKRID